MHKEEIDLKVKSTSIGAILIVIGILLFSLSTAGLLPLSISVPTFTKNSVNPILRPGASGSWDSGDVAHPTVLYHDDKFMMWYCGRSGSYWDIGLATSSDGVNWVKYAFNPILIRGSSGQPDSYTAYCPEVLWYGGKFKMWYSGFDGTKATTCYAESLDGITWTKFGRVFDVGLAGSWDSAHAYAPTVCIHEGTYCLIYYGLQISVPPYAGRIGLATSSDGIHNWTRYAGNPIFDLIPGSWESSDLGAHDILWYNGRWIFWYAGANDAGIKKIGYAESLDVMSWTKYSGNPILGAGSAGSWDDQWVTAPSVYIALDGTCYLFYEGRNSAVHYQIGLATAKFATPTDPPTDTPTEPIKEWHPFQIIGIVCAVAGVVVIAKSEYDYRKNVPRKKMKSK